MGGSPKRTPSADFDWEFAAPRKLPRPLRDAREGGGRLRHAPGAARCLPEREPRGPARAARPQRRRQVHLMRLVAGELAPQAGTRTASPELAVGFFAQLEVEQLDGGGSPLRSWRAAAARKSPPGRSSSSATISGRFGFGGERVFEPTRTSPAGSARGWRSRSCVARRPNLLLLDEPTNHLDLSLRHTLLLALQEFPGAVISSRTIGRCCVVPVTASCWSPTARSRPSRGTWRTTPRGCAPAAPPKSKRRPRRAPRAASSGARRPRHAHAAARSRASSSSWSGASRSSRASGPGSRRGSQTPPPMPSSAAAEQQQLAQDHAQLGAQIATLEERWLAVMAALEERAG